MRVTEGFSEVCEQAVRAAGKILLEKWGRVAVREKGRADLVTEADLASQETVRRTIADAFPHHALVGEEDPPDTQHPSVAAEYRWIVDPLDGTTNYVHGVPHFSVSLALERSGILLVGAIYDPVADECFTAGRGQGACLNGEPIHSSSAGRLSEALVAVGFPAVVRPDSPDLRAFFEAVTACQAIRRTGSAALNLAYVAAGRFDACWSFSTKAWDAAAGALIVCEAGGVVSDPRGTPFVLDRGHFLACATPTLHQALLALMARADP